MNKLLSANFARIKKNKVFWICMIFMFLSGVVMPIAGYTDMKQSGYPTTLDDRFFAYSFFIGILSAIFCSLFTGTEYSDGTIRNKIVVGHSRISIYLSHFITCTAAGFSMCAVFIVPYLCVGIPLLGFFETQFQNVFLFFLSTLVLSWAFSSLFTLVAMLNQSKAVVAVICILTAFVFLIFGTYLNARLNEKETYTAYSYTPSTGNTEQIVETNPNYLRGTERKIYEFLYDFLPGGQVIQLLNMSCTHPWRLCGYSLILVAVSTGIGIFFFRKKDLK